jgi:hypothetical protein
MCIRSGAAKGLLEVKSASRTIPFAIANHSPIKAAKDGPQIGYQRKRRDKRVVGYWAEVFSAPAWEKISQYPGNFAAFVDYRRRFLRLGDWVVALPGIEPGFED